MVDPNQTSGRRKAGEEQYSNDYSPISSIWG